MRATVLALTLSVLPLAAWSQEDGDTRAIVEVITDQLADFNARDVAGAWEHASPTIQSLFGTPENFGRMVESGYPMVWDNREARFLGLREEAGALRQRVLIEDPSGRGWMLDYEMIELPEGWRINGVLVLPAPDLAV